MQKMKTLTILFACVMTMSALKAQTTELVPARKWTLDDCLQYADEHATAVKKQAVRVQSAGLARQEVLAELMPTLSGNVSAQYNWGRNVDPETNTYNTITTFNNYYQLSAQVTLFDGGRTWNALKAAGLQRRQAQNTLQQAIDDTRLTVMGAFVEAVYCCKLVTMMGRKLTDSEALRHKTRRQQEVGEKSLPDVAQMEALVADDSLRLVRAQNDCDKALRTLKSAMNFPMNAPFYPDTLTALPNEPVEEPTGDTAETLFLAAQNRHPQALNATLAVVQKRLEARQAAGALLPTVSLGAAVATNYFRAIGMSAQGVGFGRQFRDNMGEYLFASVSIPIFNLPVIKRARKVRREVVLAEVEKAETLRRLHDDIAQAVADCNGYCAEMRQMSRKVQADSLAYRLSLRRYEVGMLSPLDLRTSAATLWESRVNLVKMQLLYEVKRRLVNYYRNGHY